MKDNFGRKCVTCQLTPGSWHLASLKTKHRTSVCLRQVMRDFVVIDPHYYCAKLFCFFLALSKLFHPSAILESSASLCFIVICLRFCFIIFHKGRSSNKQLHEEAVQKYTQ